MQDRSALIPVWLRPLLRRLLASQSGATMVEYGLIVSAIAVLLMAALGTLGTTLSAKFQDIADIFNTYWN